MKKVCSLILSFCLVVGVCAVLCCCSKDVNKNETSNVISDDFSYIKQAYENTLKYEGSYMVNIESRESDDENDVDTENMYYDASTEQLYITSNRGSGEFEKIYKSGNAYYRCDGEEGVYGDTVYTELHSAQAKRIFADNSFANVFSDSGKKFVGGMFLANDVNELKNAYVTYCKASAEKYSSEYKEPTVTVKQENGVYTLELSFRWYTDGDWKYCDDTLRIVARDGKIVECKCVSDIVEQNGEKTTLSQICKYEYSFNKDNVKEYDAKIDEKSASVGTINYSDVEIDFFVEGDAASSSVDVKSSTNVSDAFKNISESFMYPFTIDNWYTDKECTKKFDPKTVSADDWFMIDALYTKVGAIKNASNNAMVVYDYYIDMDNMPREYQIVAHGESYGEYSAKGWRSVQSDTNYEYELDYHYLEYNRETFVNGEKISNELQKVSAEPGKICYVKCRVFDPLAISVELS